MQRNIFSESLRETVCLQFPHKCSVFPEFAIGFTAAPRNNPSFDGMVILNPESCKLEPRAGNLLFFALRVLFEVAHL
jgi:hypothetical protein